MGLIAYRDLLNFGDKERIFMNVLMDHMFWIGLGLLFMNLGLISKPKVDQIIYTLISTFMFITSFNPPHPSCGWIGLYNLF